MKQPVFYGKTQNPADGGKNCGVFPSKKSRVFRSQLLDLAFSQATENQGRVLLRDDYTRSKHSWLEFSHHSDGMKTGKDGDFHGVFKLLVSGRVMDDAPPLRCDERLYPRHPVPPQLRSYDLTPKNIPIKHRSPREVWLDVKGYKLMHWEFQ